MRNNNLCQYFKVLFPLLGFNVFGKKAITTETKAANGVKITETKPLAAQHRKQQGEQPVFCFNGSEINEVTKKNIMVSIYQKGSVFLFDAYKFAMIGALKKIAANLPEDKKAQIDGLITAFSKNDAELIENLKNSPEHQKEVSILTAAENSFIVFSCYIICYLFEFIKQNPEQKKEIVACATAIRDEISRNMQLQATEKMRGFGPGNAEENNTEEQKARIEQQKNNDAALFHVVLTKYIEILQKLSQLLAKEELQYISERNYVKIGNKKYPAIEVVNALLKSVAIGTNTEEVQKLIEQFHKILPLVLHFAMIISNENT